MQESSAARLNIVALPLWIYLQEAGAKQVQPSPLSPHFPRVANPNPNPFP